MKMKWRPWLVLIGAGLGIASNLIWARPVVEGVKDAFDADANGVPQNSLTPMYNALASMPSVFRFLMNGM